jgi:hypothetical protein
MKLKYAGLVLLSSLALLGTFSSQAALVEVASDNANNYGDSWLGNGGFGFEEWQFEIETANGSAGHFLAQSSMETDLTNIDSNPSDKAWGTFANEDGFNQAVAYRGFGDNSLTSTGDIFNMSFEHGGILGGGAVGMVLRNQNENGSVGDYNTNARFEFGFIGGTNNYSIFDGSGTVDTGIGFTDAGLNLMFELTGVDAYKLTVNNAFDNSLAGIFTGVLAGTGNLDSVALYNRNAEEANAYFNSLSIFHSRAVNAPATAAMMLLAAGFLLRRKAIH